MVLRIILRNSDMLLSCLPHRNCCNHTNDLIDSVRIVDRQDDHHYYCIYRRHSIFLLPYLRFPGHFYACCPRHRDPHQCSLSSRAGNWRSNICECHPRLRQLRTMAVAHFDWTLSRHRNPIVVPCTSWEYRNTANKEREEKKCHQGKILRKKKQARVTTTILK